MHREIRLLSLFKSNGGMITLVFKSCLFCFFAKGGEVHLATRTPRLPYIKLYVEDRFPVDMFPLTIPELEPPYR